MNRQQVTADTRYVADGPTVFDLHTESDVGSGSVDECNAHWQRQVAAHGSVDAALAAADRAVRVVSVRSVDLTADVAANDAKWDTMTPGERTEAWRLFADRGWNNGSAEPCHPSCPPWCCRQW